MSFTDGKPFLLTEKQHKAKWGCRPGKGPHCSICGHWFKVGEKVKFVYANGTKGAGCGNFFTCSDCDGEDVLQRGIESYKHAVKLAKQWGIYGPDWQEC